MQRKFDEEQRLLKERLLRMGSLAESALYRAVDALLKRDAARLAEIPAIEREVNALEIEVDERAMQLIALRQPRAQDLRFLVMAIKIASEVERISDQAVNIAQSTERLLAEPPLARPPALATLVEKSLRMLRDAIDAFVRGDAEQAQRVIDADDEVDRLRDDQFRALVTTMVEDPRSISRSLSLILIARNLERVADHATNVAEEVIYLVEAREVRAEEPAAPPASAAVAPPPQVLSQPQEGARP